MRRSSVRPGTAGMATLAMLLVLTRPVAAGESLAGLRADVRTPPSGSPEPQVEKPDKPSPQYDDGYPNDYDDEEDDSMTLGAYAGLVSLGTLVVASPFWYPHLMMGDSLQTPAYFSHYPYQYGDGYMLVDPAEALGLEGSRVPYRWSVRARGEFGNGLDDLDWIGGRLLVETKSRWGVEGDFRYVLEDLGGGIHDDAWLGDGNVLFRFAQSEWLQFRTGLGVNYLSDREGTDLGFNFTYAVDAQPVRPLVFTAELDLGTLGNASVVHVRTTAGVVLGVSEAYIGYDLYDIGSTQIQGLVAGIQIWY
ncbi:MAG: hypothetical protein MUF06_10410 [Pirellulaceae bacterium]|nr:hypothetical protein [Pirellulaceae bacterium]